MKRRSNWVCRALTKLGDAVESFLSYSGAVFLVVLLVSCLVCALVVSSLSAIARMTGR